MQQHTRRHYFKTPKISKSVKDAALHRELNLVYTPPYQPDFNPDENAFSVIKSHTRRFDNSISESITLLTSDKISCFYEHSRNFIRTFIDNWVYISTHTYDE
jgi:transposase